MELINKIDETFKFDNKEIRVTGTSENPFFIAKDICDILGLTNITEALRNIPEKWRTSEILKCANGQNMNMIVLTEPAVYKIIMRSNKPIAQKFQEVVCEEILPTIRKKGEYKMQILIDKNKQLEEEKNKIKDQLQNKDEEHLHDKMLEKHDLLIQKLKKKNCVYLATVDGKNLLKIGSTNNIEERINGLRMTFKTNNIYFVDTFECGDNHRNIEQLILHEPEIRNNLYKSLINGHKSFEVIELTEELTYNHVYNKVNDILKNNNGILNLTATQLLEHKKLDFQKEKMNFIKDLIDKQFSLQDIKDLFSLKFENNDENDKDNESNEDNEHKLEPIIYEKNIINTSICKRKTDKTKKIQQINVDDLTIYKIYESISDLVRLNPTFSSKQIRRAIISNKTYENFRWNYEGELINPTVKTGISSKVTPVLRLNKDKTEILDTFPTKKLVALFLNVDSNSVKKIIDNQKIVNNNYYILYTDCSKELLDKYNKPISFYSNHTSIKIKQINPVSKQEIIFNSISDASKQYGINIQTITKCIKNKTPYKGSLWEYEYN
jgi:prophage antirepressor-like protein